MEQECEEYNYDEDHVVDEGDMEQYFESWKEENIEGLTGSFFEEKQDEFEEYCKSMFREHLREFEEED